MEVKITPFGNHRGLEVNRFKIQVPGGITAEFCSLGATLVGCSVPGKDGEDIQTVCGFETPEEYSVNPPFFGVTVGPVANRIARAGFTLAGKQYSLQANDGKNTLHSGPDCSFAYKVFEAQCFESEDAAGVVFTYKRPKNEGGFPGNLTLEASYWVTKNNSLILAYRGITDADTPVNITNHAYFNLNGEVAGGSILDHELAILADRYQAVNGEFLPTGELPSVVGPMDFRQKKAIGKEIDHVPGGYDHCYILNNDTPEWKSGLEPTSIDASPEYLQEVLRGCESENPQTGRRLRLAASARGDKSGVQMDVYTNQLGTQFYSGNMLPSQGIKGRSGKVYTPRTAFCLETQGYNDAVNHPEFPSIILNPDEVYERTTVHQFEL
jgi:aldose 1-epimerase